MHSETVSVKKEYIRTVNGPVLMDRVPIAMKSCHALCAVTIMKNTGIVIDAHSKLYFTIAKQA